jgi:hypothetical protein
MLVYAANLLQVQIPHCNSNYTLDVTCLQSHITFIVASKNTDTKSVEINDNKFHVIRPLLILRGRMMSRFHLGFMRNGLLGPILATVPLV